MEKITAAKQAIGGVCFYGDANMVGLPTSATGDIPSEMVDLGDLSDTGVQYDAGYSTQEVANMSGDVVRHLGTKRGETYKFELLCANTPEAKALIFPYVKEESDGSITVKSNNRELDAHSFVLDIALDDETLQRIVIPNGKITAIDTVTYVSTSIVKYGVTVACMLGTDGYAHEEYTATIGA